MTGTEITPLHPFQDDLSCLKADQRLTHHHHIHDLDAALDKKDSFRPEVTNVKNEFNTTVSSPCPSLSTIASSSPSSMRASRLSLPSIWNNSNNSTNNSGDTSSVFDSYCLSTTLPMWSSSSFCDLPTLPNKSTDINAPKSPCGYQPTPNSLRNIWYNSSPSMNHIQQQQQQHLSSHQRRMSLSDYNLSDDRSSLVPETQHTAKGYSDQMNGYGRRHSVAGSFVPKTTNNNVYRWMQDSHTSSYPTGGGAAVTNDYSMKAIDEDESFVYANTQYSRYQQHILNKGILDHIDEYFGGGGGGGGGNHKKNGIPDIDTNLNHSSYFINMKSGSPTKTSSSSSSSSPSATLTPLDANFGKTMTAGGDAITFGCSNLLMGKGIPLHHFLDSNTLLYLVEFKTSRTDICYIMQGDDILPQIGDLVITEADRGRDLGKVMNILTANTILQQQKKQTALDDTNETVNDGNDNEDSTISQQQQQQLQKCQVKRLYRLANDEEIASLATKQLDEEKALFVCQAKIQQKELPMQVVNAEYQWDRRKLTFYFMADQRIDFRELVRELFKTYKTRIWMCALKSNTNNKLAGL